MFSYAASALMLLWHLQWHCCYSVTGGMLFPRESESRQNQYLNGIWNFRADTSPHRNEGMEQKWYLKPLSQTGSVIPMPVPSSFNDITTDRSLQNFIGWVWYDREFYISSDWKNKRIVLRVDSAHYNAVVWMNGEKVMEHSGGHLPFESCVNNVLNYSEHNRVTVAVNNTLTPHTLPPATTTYHTNAPNYPPGYFVQTNQFDFFNYAGIHRNVLLYTTPTTYIDDITVLAAVSGAVKYSVVTKQMMADRSMSVNNYQQNVFHFQQTDIVSVEVVDHLGTVVASGSGAEGLLTIKNVQLWWPYTMVKDHAGYLYTLKVTVQGSTGVDVYRQPFGVRSIKVTSTQLLINGRPFYCLGVAKHEDSDIRGKGLDLPLIIRDFNMMKWMGVGCFRTSHYPYAEEIMEQADRQGFVVIDECPGVGIQQDENFSNISLTHHLEVMDELVRRDKNRPSAVIWSVANEPSSNNKHAEYYFGRVINHTRSLDNSRLVSAVINKKVNKDRVAQLTDILCLNRYFGWYQDTGHLDTIPYQLSYDFEQWYKRLNKPIILTEFGADTVAGLHKTPSYVFTEDYQVDFLREYHSVFDVFRSKYLVGEMVWNFADFMTDPSVTRVDGNKKGLLTRQRQPKAAAHVIRQRYWSIINETVPFVVMP